MYKRLHVKYPRHSCQILKKLEFSAHSLEETTRVPNFMKICPMEAELFHEDGQTDVQTDGETGKT
jgi:hypothetical protein